MGKPKKHKNLNKTKPKNKHHDIIESLLKNLLLRTFANGPLYKNTLTPPKKQSIRYVNLCEIKLFVKLYTITNICIKKYFSTSQKKEQKKTTFIYRFSDFSAVFHISFIYFIPKMYMAKKKN